MTGTVTSQFIDFLYIIMTGILAGLFYDVYAGLGQVLRLRKIGIFVGDIVFWLVLTPAVYALLLYYNQGEVRFFVLLGFALGAGGYFLVTGRRVRKLVVVIIEQLIKLFRLVVRGFCWIAMVLMFPFKILFLMLAFPFRILGAGIRFVGRGAGALLRVIIPAPVKRLVRKLTGLFRKVIDKVSNLMKKIKSRGHKKPPVA